MAKQRPLWSLNQAFAKYNLAACIKGGLEILGYQLGVPLLPQAPLPPEGIEEVRVRPRRCRRPLGLEAF